MEHTARHSARCAFSVLTLLLLGACNSRSDAPEERIGNFRFQYTDFQGYLEPSLPSYLTIRHGRTIPTEVRAPDGSGHFTAIEARLSGPEPIWLVSSAKNIYLLKEAPDGSVSLTALPNTEKGPPQATLAAIKLGADRWFIRDGKMGDLKEGAVFEYTGRVLDERTLRTQLLPLRARPDEVDFDTEEMVSVSPDNSTTAWFSYLFSEEKKGRIIAVDKEGATMPPVKLHPLLYARAPHHPDGWSPWFDGFARWHRTKEGRWVVDVIPEKSSALVEKQQREQEAVEACRKRRSDLSSDFTPRHEAPTTQPIDAVALTSYCDPVPAAGENRFEFSLRRNAMTGGF